MHVNNDFQRNSNISHILDTLWHNDKNVKGLSRIDISRNLNLYRSTVSNVIQTLLDNHLILEGETGTATEKGGRKPVTLSINEKFGCIVGIEIQTDIYNVCVVSFDGSTMYENTGNTLDYCSCESQEENEKNFEELLDRILNKVMPKIKELKVPLLCICVGLPGIINVDQGIIIESQPFGLKNYNYAKLLGTKYNVPFLMENDAKCCSWFISAEKNEAARQDFLCVLTRNHRKNGISVGVSISLNGHVINGHNYAVGEYVSRSWTPSKKTQTGLPQAVLSTVETVEDSYREWVTDLFATLTTFIPLLEPNTVYLFGQQDSRQNIISEVIENQVPQFKAIMERCDSTLKIVNSDDSIIAKGAAFMFILKMFEIPFLEDEECYSRLTWDRLFEIQSSAL